MYLSLKMYLSRVGHIFRSFHPYTFPGNKDTHGINTARTVEVNSKRRKTNQKIPVSSELKTGVDGRLQEVVLHAQTRPTQLRHWLRDQQAQIQRGQIKSLISSGSLVKDIKSHLLSEGPPMQTILMVPEKRLP